MLLKKLFQISNKPHDQFHDIRSGVALGLLSIFWFGVTITTIERIRVYDPSTTIKVLTLIGATIGVYVAIWKLVADLRWRRSEVYLEQAKEFYEKSYNILEVEPETGYPKNSRQLWLSSSRMLLSAQALGEKISDPSHLETFKEYTEYWRIQFRELLDFDGEKSPNEHYFYEENALHAWSSQVRAPIAERSVAVLYRFTEWPDDQIDRLSLETDFTEKEIEKLEKFGVTGIVNFCRRRRRQR